MNPLQTVGISKLAEVTRGRAEVSIGLIDGVVDVSDSRLKDAHIQNVNSAEIACNGPSDEGCRHATLLAATLVGLQDGACPACTLLVHPIFTSTRVSSPPVSDAMTLASALVDTVEAGASVINLSLAVNNVGRQAALALTDVLNFACSRGVIVVAASGNGGELATSPITAHPWVIPVVAYNGGKSLLSFSNIGRSVGMNGLGAPGIVASADGVPQIAGTSVAAVFVTAAAALLRSALPESSPGEVIHALRAASGNRGGVIPPLLDVWASYLRLKYACNSLALPL